MWAESVEERALVEELSRGMVAKIAPEEVDLFDELMQEYFENPEPPDPTATASEEKLGFGLGGVLVAVTPAAAAVVGKVLEYLVKEIIKTVNEEAPKIVMERLKVLFFPKEKDGGALPLTTDQLKQIHDLAYEQALVFGVAVNQAQVMAKAMVGSLALAPGN